MLHDTDVTACRHNAVSQNLCCTSDFVEEHSVNIQIFSYLYEHENMAVVLQILYDV